MRRSSRFMVTGVLGAAVALGAFTVDGWGTDASRGTAPRFVTDAHGRSLILHGLNTQSSAKSAPDGIPTAYDEKFIELERKELGSNLVRFLLQWRNVEPRPGVYDDAYLDRVAQWIRWYEKRGIIVLLDMHQDVYGPGVNGNGAPLWATQSDGLPAPATDPWELGYLQPGTMRAFDHFWNTTGEHPELRDHYARMWGHVAARFAADANVVGYDLMNEPWGGSLPGVQFERGPLSDLYQRTTEEIRKTDRTKWVFVEPRAVGVNWGLASGLRPIDDPAGKIGYAPHLYPLPLDLGNAYVGADKAWTDRTLNAWRDTITDTARRQNAPIILGEYGLDAAKPGALDLVDAVARLTDQMHAGRVYWSSDPDRPGKPAWSPWFSDHTRTELGRRLAVPYPRAVAGTPVTNSYDPATRTLTLVYTADPKITAPTEFWLPSDATVTGGTGSWNRETGLLEVRAGTSGTRTITVALR
ncbi:hypothetical protein GCM10027589_37190 [Actinocorallia lasiicapitis]